MSANPWAGMSFVLAILGALLAFLAAARHRYHPEAARKALHVSMGLVTLAFPWIFDRSWPVLVLAGLVLAGFLALRARTPAARRWGHALHGVGRASCGEIWFVLGACGLFILAAGEALMFCVPILILTFADAAAALAGTRFGRRRYRSCGGEKTLEGSAAFLIVALCSAYLPLALLAPPASAGHAATALLVAVAATALEAIAARGLDNLLIPLGAYAVLKTSLPSTVAAAGTGSDPAAPMALFSATALTVLLLALLARRMRAPALPRPVLAGD